MIMNVFAAATVLAIIKRSRKGVDVATLKTKTGFEGRKISYHEILTFPKAKIVGSEVI